MPKQPMSIASELLRPFRIGLPRHFKNKQGRAFMAARREEIATALAEAEKRGMMFGAAVMAGHLVNGMREEGLARGGLEQFASTPAAWAGLGLTNYDMRAVRDAFKKG